MGPTIKNVATPSSEIDDIFTRKTKTTTLQTNQQSSSDPKQKRRKKKRSETQNPEPKRAPPEIVLDPSTQPSHTSKTIQHDRSVPPKKKRKVVETKVDQEKFTDSRGTGPRKRPLPLPSASLSSRPSQAAKPMKDLQYIKRTNSGLMQCPEVSLALQFVCLFTSP
jgi:hypothetical protein